METIGGFFGGVVVFILSKLGCVVLSMVKVVRLAAGLGAPVLLAPWTNTSPTPPLPPLKRVSSPPLGFVSLGFVSLPPL